MTILKIQFYSVFVFVIKIYIIENVILYHHWYLKKQKPFIEYLGFKLINFKLL